MKISVYFFYILLFAIPAYSQNINRLHTKTYPRIKEDSTLWKSLFQYSLDNGLIETNDACDNPETYHLGNVGPIQIRLSCVPTQWSTENWILSCQQEEKVMLYSVYKEIPESIYDLIRQDKSLHSEESTNILYRLLDCIDESSIQIYKEKAKKDIYYLQLYCWSHLIKQSEQGYQTPYRYGAGEIYSSLSFHNLKKIKCHTQVRKSVEKWIKYCYGKKLNFELYEIIRISEQKKILLLCSATSYIHNVDLIMENENGYSFYHCDGLFIPLAIAGKEYIGKSETSDLSKFVETLCLLYLSPNNK